MNIIITGPRHCGKSTLVSRIMENFSGSVSGFITQFDNRESDSRELDLRSIDGSLHSCAVRWTDGKPELNPEAFDLFAPGLIDLKSNLVLIDELGKFEKNCELLKEAVLQAFDSPCHLLAVIRLDAEGWMQELKKRDDVLCISVNDLNRDELTSEILNIINTH